MPILVMCSNPACSELFDAPDEAVGKKVRCPTCGTVQDVFPNPRLAAPQAPAPAAQTAPPAGPNQATPASPQAAAPAAPSPSAGEFKLEAAGSQTPPPAQAPQSPTPAAPQNSSSEVVDLVPLQQQAAAQPSAAGQPAPAVGPISAGRAESSSEKSAAGEKPGATFQATTPKRVGGEGEAEEGGDFELSAAADTETRERSFKAPAGEAEPKKIDVKPDDEIKFSALLEDPLPLTDDGAVSGPAIQEVVDGVLENKWAELLIFVLGLVGMAAGLAMGLLYLDFNAVANAYLGAVLGWVAGFTLAFLIVLGAEKSEVPKARCPVCKNVFPPETELCEWCGSPLAEPTFNPLASDCLSAGAYATTSPGGVIWMSLLLAFVATVLELFRLLPEQMPQASQAAPAMIVVGALVGLGVLAYLLQFFLSAISETVSRSRAAPDLPSFFSARNFVDGVKFLALCVLYIVPVFTLPLMPLGVLGLAKPGNVSPFNLRGMSRVLGSHAKDFVILWLLLLMWGAALVLAIALLAVVYITVSDISLLQGLEGSADLAVHLIGTFLAALAASAAVCVFGLTLSRCIGMFGRHNANILFPAREAPADAPPAQPAAEQKK